MSNELLVLKNILKALIKLYRNAIVLTIQERACLIEIYSDNLIEIIKKKQHLSNIILKLENKLKKILAKYNAKNISELLSLKHDDIHAKNIETLNEELKKTIYEFKTKNDINRTIAKEHLEFFTGLLSVYASFLSSANYDRHAKTTIDSQTMNVRV